MALAHRTCSFVALFAVAGCGGVQAGGQTGEESDGRCAFATTPLTPREVSPLGFSAEQVLALAEGEQEATFGWLQTDGVEFGPEHGTGHVTLRTSAAGPAKLARVETGKSVGFCEDHVRIPVTVELATAGGAFDESFTTNLVAPTADEVAVTDIVPSEKLHGAFAFSNDTLAGRRFLRLEVNLRFRAAGSAGSLLGGIEGGDEASGTTSFQTVPLACWGDIPILSPDCNK